MAKESGEASAPKQNPPSTLGHVVAVAGNKNDAVVGSNDSSKSNDSKSKSNDDNGDKECSNNATMKVALEDATRKKETKQASPKASNKDNISSSNSSSNNSSSSNNNTKATTSPPSTPSRVTVATETQKNSNNKADGNKSDTDKIAKKIETKKPAPKAAVGTKDVEKDGGSTNDLKESMTKTASPKALPKALPKSLPNTVVNTAGGTRTNSTDAKIADSKTEVATKKPLPKAVSNTSNTSGTNIIATALEKSGWIAGQKIPSKTMKSSLNTVGNNESKNNITNDAKTSGGINDAPTESKTKIKEAPSNSVGSITDTTPNTKDAEKSSNIVEGKNQTETKKPLPKEAGNSNNSSSNNKNIGKSNIEKSGGFADDFVESKTKKAPPKVISNTIGTKNGTKDAEKSSKIADDNTRSVTKTPSQNQTELKTKSGPSKEAGNTANTTDGDERTQKRKRNTTNTNGVDDVEMSGGFADDRTEANAKRAPPKEAEIAANTTERNEKTQERNRTTTNTTGVDDSKESSSENSNSIDQMNSFRSSAEDTLAKALLLATRHRESKIPQIPNKKLASTPNASPAAEAKVQPNETNIPIEVLRDLINQHPGEFWQSIDNRVVHEPKLSKAHKTTTGGNTAVDLIERTETMPPHKKAADNEKQISDNQAKRRKLECQKETPSIEDRETLAAVRVLLEASIHQLSLTGRGDDAAKCLLEHVKMLSSKAASSVSAATGGEINISITQLHVPMDLEEGCVVRGKKGDRAAIDVQDMARKVTLSFVQDLSEILRAMANARSSIGATAGKESTVENKSNLQPSKSPTKPLETAVEDSLFCDEENLVQLREDGDQNMDDSDDDDDEIIEISQDDNYVQQHLVCKETLFMEPPNTKSKNVPTIKYEEGASGDILVAQKLALLRETKRLIRIKTLVLTKRRLAIQGDEDLSIVI